MKDKDSKILETIYENRKVFYSWMDKKGKIYSIKPTKTHGDFALLFAKNPHEKENYLNNMFKDGWLRLTFYGDDVYAHNTINKPNSTQMNELVNRSIEHNIRRIIWDNEDIDKVLWANENY